MQRCSAHAFEMTWKKNETKRAKSMDRLPSKLALQQHRRATNRVRSGFPKRLARASQQHFSRTAAPLLFLLSSMTLLFKRMYVLFSPTPAQNTD